MMDGFVMAASLAVAFGGIASAYFSYRTAKHREREQQLKRAESALTRHYDAVERISADPAVSENFKIFMLSLSELISDRRVAGYAVQEMVEGRLFVNKPVSEDTEFLQELRRLRDTRPDLIDDIESAVSTAIFALIFRWPETASVGTEFFARALENERTGIRTVTKLAKQAIKSRSEAGIPFTGNGLAHC